MARPVSMTAAAALLLAARADQPAFEEHLDPLGPDELRGLVAWLCLALADRWSPEALQQYLLREELAHG